MYLPKPGKLFAVRQRTGDGEVRGLVNRVLIRSDAKDGVSRGRHRGSCFAASSMQERKYRQELPLPRLTVLVVCAINRQHIILVGEDHLLAY